MLIEVLSQILILIRVDLSSGLSDLVIENSNGFEVITLDVEFLDLFFLLFTFRLLPHGGIVFFLFRWALRLNVQILMELGISLIILLFNAFLFICVTINHLMVSLFFFLFPFKVSIARQFVPFNFCVVEELQIWQRSENVINLRFLMQIDMDGDELGHGRDGQDVSLQVFKVVAIQIELLNVGEDTQVFGECGELVLSQGKLGDQEKRVTLVAFVKRAMRGSRESSSVICCISRSISSAPGVVAHNWSRYSDAIIFKFLLFSEVKGSDACRD